MASRKRRRVVWFERHRLGPRAYLFGVRLHEWHLGVALLVIAGVLYATRLVTGSLLR